MKTQLPMFGLVEREMPREQALVFTATNHNPMKNPLQPVLSLFALAVLALVPFAARADSLFVSTDYGGGIYEFDTANNRLIVEWNEVPHYGGSDPTTATFQAILSLNTGSNWSDIIFNYPDLDIGDSGYNNGASATVASDWARGVVAFADTSAVHSSGPDTQYCTVIVTALPKPRSLVQVPAAGSRSAVTSPLTASASKST